MKPAPVIASEAKQSVKPTIVIASEAKQSMKPIIAMASEANQSMTSGCLQLNSQRHGLPRRCAPRNNVANRFTGRTS